MQDLNVSLIQCNQVWEDKSTNLTHYNRLLEEVEEETSLIVFPEMFHTGFSMNVEALAESMKGETMQWLKTKAKEKNAAFVASLIIKENELYYNRLVMVEPNATVHHYDKQKLFTYSNEEKHYTPGSSNKIIEYNGWKILFQVCYDLRFPKMAENYIKNKEYLYDLLINVANWPSKREEHWKTLLKARAIENQSYVIGVNRVGRGDKNLYYSGFSSIIKPDGIIVKQVEEKEVVINSKISKKELKDIRKKLPFLKDL